MNTALFPLLTSHWWLLLVRGILAILFGLFTFAWPSITVVMLIIWFGAFALVDGILSLLSLGRVGSTVHRWWLLLSGTSGIGAATIIYLYPFLSAWLLLVFIGMWSVIRGVGEIIGAIHVRKKISGEWSLVLSGLISLGFGFFVLTFPGEGAVSARGLIGLYAIVIGVLLSGVAFRLRRHGLQLLLSATHVPRAGTQARIY